MVSTIIKKTKINKILSLAFVFIMIPALVLSFLSSNMFLENNSKLIQNQNLNTNTKFADAAGPNTGDLIIGKVETANTIELSVCVKATPGPLHLNNVSVWFGYNTTALTPTTGSILEKGQYGKGTDGYGQLKWQAVSGAINGDLNTYTMRLDFSDNGDPAIIGLPMATTTPELYGRVKFDKAANSTASTDITLNRNQFFTSENTTTPLVQQIVNVNVDCRNSVCPNNTTSANGYIAPNACASSCPSGEYLETTTSTCKTCPANSYCTLGTTIPTQCGTNQTSPAGSTLVTQCVTSCINGATNPPSCNQCPVGEYLNNSVCSPCPAGSFCSTTTCPTTNCPPTACPPGQTSPAGSIAQSACFTPTCTNGATNPSACNLCPAGTSFVTSSGSCVACTAGQYCPGPNPPVLCPANSYCPTPGPDPVPCPPGKTSPAGSTQVSQCITPVCANGATNSPACNQCPAGQYLNSSICSPCPAGSYCPSPPPVCMTATCPPPTCPAGKTSPVGSKLLSDCISKDEGGGTIVITTNSSSSSTRSSSISSSVSSAIPIVFTPQSSVFKSQIRITDPYICGEGAYGNVQNAAEIGVQNVSYDLYKQDSNVPSYSYKLKLNSGGDFFLPISQSTNIVKEGNYKIVFYAVDNDGGKAQGEYNAYLTDSCQSQGVTSGGKGSVSDYDAVRTGGFSAIASIVATLLILTSLYFYKKSKVKKLFYEAKNTDEF